MDYYNTMRTDFIHKAMYPEDPMRVDWIPKGPPQGTLTIKPKERCAPRIVTKIEGAAVEEGHKVFFEGIVDAKPQPKFSWYFNDEPIFPGQKGFEEAEVHDSRRMSTLILKYAREHHMGKYTLVISNQLGTAECSCDLIVRKKQFPPVFWQRLYNVGDEGSRRFVGGVEVGGWPVPDVFWYKVAEDGTETEVTSKTHTENWNGNPNKYVPSSKVEVRQIDDIRHCIVFHEVSCGDSGTYRVRAVNCLGEAECEAELNFDEYGESSGEMYLPPLWREKRRLTWRDMDVYDQRKKPFVDVDEPSLTPEELAEMKMKSGMVPLSRITEYFASLPDYKPTDRFRNLERMPFKPGVDEHDYRPDRKGSSRPAFPSKFERGKITHHGYVSDASGRILPWWFNKSDPNARDSSDWRWTPVHPNLFVPELPPMTKCPDPPPVWETDEDLAAIVKLLRSMGCRMEEARMVEPMKKGSGASQPVKQSVASDNSRSFISERSEASENTQHHVEQKGSKVKKFSYTGGVAEAEEYSSSSKVVSSTEQVSSKTTNVRKEWEERLEKNVVAQQTNAADFTAQFLTTEEKTSKKKETMYQRQENLSFPELEQMSTQPPPALPPKTKIKHSPSRNIFSPTDSLENAGKEGTASIKSVEFIPVKEKVKLIAAQQEELLRKEEHGSKKTSETHKSRGVRILPPSPVTVRKMSVEEELHHYDSDVTRSTPTIAFLETPPPRPELPDMPMYQFQEVKESKEAMRKETETDYSTLDSGLSHSVASFQQSSQQQSSSVQMSSSSQMTSSHVQEMSEQQTFSEQQTYSSTSSYTTHKSSRAQVPGWSDSPVLSLEEQRQKEEVLTKAGNKLGVNSSLDQLVAETESVTSQETHLFQHQEEKTQQMHSSSSVTTTQIDSTAVTDESFSASLKSPRVVETPAEECRRSFEEAELEAMALETHSNASLSKQSSIVESASVQSFVFHKEDKSESESSFRSRKPLKSASTAFVRAPETFTHSQPPSCPTTPMSQRRRLRINQSPKPPAEEEARPKYREGTEGPFKPGFYRPPPEETTSSNPIFKLIRRNNSKTNLAQKDSEGSNNPAIRISAASSKAYEADSES